MANPQNLTWTGPTQYTDGTPFGQADFAGYQVDVNGQPAVGIPVAWSTNNQYSFPIVKLPNLKQGANTVAMATVAANGMISDFTPAVSFNYLSVPQPPAGVAVA